MISGKQETGRKTKDRLDGGHAFLSFFEWVALRNTGITTTCATTVGLGPARRDGIFGASGRTCREEQIGLDDRKTMSTQRGDVDEESSSSRLGEVEPLMVDRSQGAVLK